MLSATILRDIFIDRAFDEIYDLHAYLKDQYSYVGVMDFSTPSKLMSFIMDHIVTSEYHETSEEEDKDTLLLPHEDFDIEAQVNPMEHSVQDDGDDEGDDKDHKQALEKSTNASTSSSPLKVDEAT